jgi:broad specificity phosphatase PhoE
MNDSTVIFLRHAETEKNPSVNAVFWVLSEKGITEAKKVSELPVFNTIDIIYTSEEKKSILTAEPIAQKNSKNIQSVHFFNEVVRGDKFLTKEEFEQEKKLQLLDLDYKAFDGESGNDALKRFIQGVDSIVRENNGKTILIVTHGTILNIYFAYLLNKNDILPERWNKTAFCAYGIVKDGKVIKDII